MTTSMEKTTMKQVINLHFLCLQTINHKFNIQERIIMKHSNKTLYLMKMKRQYK